MKHQFLVDMAGDLCYSSNNLIFSARWLDQYVKTFKLPVVQCSKKSIFGSLYQGELSEQMKYSFKKDDKIVVKDLLKKKLKLSQELKGLDTKLMAIGRDHHFNFLGTV